MEAITTTDQPLLVVAGAGSGKTRVLTRRIAWRVQDGSAVAEHVLAITFTRKAAAELRARLAALGVGGEVSAGTFHAVALRELRRHALDTGRRPPVLLDSKGRFLAELFSTSGPPNRSSIRREVLGQLAAEIEWAAARLLRPEQYPAAARHAGRETSLEPETVAELIARYEAEKRRRGVVDFEDLLRGLARAIADDREFAAVQRWRWRHLFVDELQDVNAAQLALLDAWLGDGDDVCAVGDGRQAIYGWNGAEADALRLFVRRFPAARVIELRTNYRSTPQVVTLAGAALGRPAPLRAVAAGRPASLAAPAVAARPDGAVPTMRCFEDETAEAIAVARGLRLARRPGRRFSECAVLARTNAQLVLLERVLRAEGVPLGGDTGERFLERRPVREALAELRRARGRDAFARWAADLRLTAVAASGGAAATGVELADAGPDDPGGGDPARPSDHAVEAERADLADLAGLAAEYLGFDPVPGPEGFLAWLRGTPAADLAPSARDGVDLLTFHRAKGLEWSVVFVTGLEDGFVPIAHAATPAALEEERRLLYVALTRAVDELHCSWCSTRAFGRRRSRREPSPWLGALDETRRELERASRPDPSRARAALAAARAELDRARSGLDGDPWRRRGTPAP